MKAILLLLTLTFQISNAIPTLNIALQTNDPCADSPTVAWTISPDDSRIKSYVLLIKGIEEKFEYNQPSNVEGGYGIDMPRPCSGSIFQIFYNIPTETKTLPAYLKTKLSSKSCLFYLRNQSSYCNYECVVHAIDIVLDPEKTKTIDDLMSQINGHIIVTGSTKFNLPPRLN